MDKVILKVQHCYGIPLINHEFDFTNKNMPVALYAPNGMMKTSLAKCIHDYVNGKDPVDIIFPTKDSTFEICDEDGNLLEPDSIFVIDSINEKFQSGRISTLLASESLKSQYDHIYDDIGNKRETLLKKLKKNSGISKDIDSVFSSDFSMPVGGFLTALARLEREVKNEKHLEYGDLKYRTIFNDKVLGFISNPDFESLIEEYTSVYEKILDNSRYFKQGIFNHSNAETIAKNLKANGWFEGGHSVNLKDTAGGVEISTEKELADAIEHEKEAILNDDTLKKMFAKVDKALSNSELKTFRDYLIENPFLASELKDLDYLKSKIWVAYLIKNKTDYFDLIHTYDESEEKLKDIISQAESEQTHWEEVIGIFNRRFSVPFTVCVENKSDAVLNLASPQIVFYFNDENNKASQKISRDLLDTVLSNGEKRALYILNIIFEVEARKQGGIETLCIIDDIADSFDYKNKYAIIEYLWEMKESPLFHLIIMTHNFDFYRTVKGRLSIYGENRLLASKSQEKIIIVKDELGDNPFSLWKKNLDQVEYLIASIPFVRNIAEYIGNEEAFNTLTALLHIKPTTSGISFSDIKRVFSEILLDGAVDIVPDSDEPILDKIFETCDFILADSADGIHLEKKVVLSIGIRLRAEQILINKIQDDDYVDNIKKNQTSKLVRKYSRITNPDLQILETMHQVSLMTPENIHLNSFMFEPILDMSMHHLIALYQDLKTLN